MQTCIVCQDISCSPQLLEECGSLDMLLERLDVKELCVHLGPLVLQHTGMTTEAWAMALSVGVGMASLEAKRTEDNKGVVTGLLRDYPSIYCTLSMDVSEEENELVLYLKQVYLELNGKD